MKTLLIPGISQKTWVEIYYLDNFTFDDYHNDISNKLIDTGLGNAIIRGIIPEQFEIDSLTPQILDDDEFD